MARTATARGADKRRERAPARAAGLGLTTAAVLALIAAVVLAFAGAFAASRSNPGFDAQADALGAALVGLLTAPEPEWWQPSHGTFFEDVMRRVRAEYPDNTELPSLPKERRDRMLTEDHRRKQRAKERLRVVESAAGSFASGVLRGLQLQFHVSGYENLTAGAGLPPGQTLTAQRRLGDVNVATTSLPSTAGAFRARIYHREYKDAAGKKVGDAYVVLSEAALEGAAGGGAWLLLTPLLVGLAGAGFLLAASRASTGLSSLTRDLEAIGRGRLDLRVSVNAPGEVGAAQRAADRMAKNLALIQSTGSGDLDEALEKELGLATQIHQNLRPADPPRVSGYEVETLFKGGRDIGGDYFDYLELDEQRLALVIADCSENLRGVPAAMVMAMTRAFLLAAADPATGPADWLKTVNRRLSRDLRGGMAVTAYIALVDLPTGEVTAVSAGHRPMVLWRAGKTATVNPNGIALGLDVGPVFDKTIEEKRITLQKGDRIVLYTDGVISAQNEAGESYGEDRLFEAVRKQGAMNSAAFVNFVASGVDAFAGGAEQTDDITISTLKRVK